jgi:transcription initiation factor TFIIIB Brf1 subunit/transcription initiation factor TFIIB
MLADPHYNVCNDCGSHNIKLDWAAGDRVCTDCGLVKEAHCVDDRAEWRCFEMTDKATENQCRVGTVVKDLDTPLSGTRIGDKRLAALQFRCDPKEPPIVQEATRIVRFVLGMDEAVAEETIKWLKTGRTSVPKKQAVIAVAIYIACDRLQRGIRLQHIIGALGVDQRSFWAVYSHYHPQQQQQSHGCLYQQLVRTIHTLDWVPTTMTWTVLKVSRQLCEHIKKDPILSAKKPSKLVAALVYVACRIANIHCTIDNVCTSTGVSKPTIREHEKHIQRLLQSTRATST